MTPYPTTTLAPTPLWKRGTLEFGPKVLFRKDDAFLDGLFAELFRSYRQLLKHCEAVSLLFWLGDGTDILHDECAWPVDGRSRVTRQVAALDGNRARKCKRGRRLDGLSSFHDKAAWSGDSVAACEVEVPLGDVYFAVTVLAG